MNKVILALLVLAAVAVLLSPGIIGGLAERSMDENLRWAAEESGDVVVTAENFDRGWFSSEGRHRIEIRDPELRAAIREFSGSDTTDGFPVLIVDTRLDHGLIPVASLGREEGSLRPGLGRGVSTMLIEFPDGEKFPLPGTVYSNINLDGAVVANYIAEPGMHTAGDIAADWGNIDVRLSTNPESRSVAVNGAIESLSIIDGSDALHVDQASFRGNQRPTHFELAEGEIEIEIVSIAVEENGNETIGFGPLTLAARSSLNDDRFNSDARASITALPVPGYGDMDFDVEMRLDNVDGASAGKLFETLNEVPDDVPPQLLFDALEDDLKRLTAAGFDIHVDRFDFDLPQGPVTATMRFTVEESDGSVFEWTSLLLALDAEADLVVSAEFVDFAIATNPEAGAVVGMGFLRQKGDAYEMHAEYAKGLLTVNGAPMPIPVGR